MLFRQQTVSEHQTTEVLVSWSRRFDEETNHVHGSEAHHTRRCKWRGRQGWKVSVMQSEVMVGRKSTADPGSSQQPVVLELVQGPGVGQG